MLKFAQESNSNKLETMRDKDNKKDIPPCSRLFVLHGKNAAEEELREAFEKFGKIEDLWMVRDRESHELKGVTYVKFSKMSEAALAVEEMNGETLPSSPRRPLRVMIANSRCQRYRKDEDMDRFLRLFIVVPRDDTENEETLHEYFQIFGDVEYVNILRNRETNESKGFAYIKYSRMYNAAKALEDCDPKYKAVLAKPKDKRERTNYNNTSRDYNHAPATSRRGDLGEGYAGNQGYTRDSTFMSAQLSENQTPANSRRGDLCEGYATNQGYTRVSAFISTQLSEDLAIRLFDLTPGLAFARPDDVISHRTQKMVLEYETPESAAFAVDRLNGFEYPIGEPIMLKPESEWTEGSSHSSRRHSKSGSNDRKRDHEGSQMRSIGSTSNYCTAHLPPVQPPVKGEEGNHRLLVVCQPEVPPILALRDVFCRFGNFVDIQLTPGKNYGYAFYTSEESAHHAIEVLHGEALLGNRLKVKEAESRAETKKSRYE